MVAELSWFIFPAKNRETRHRLPVLLGERTCEQAFLPACSVDLEKNYIAEIPTVTLNHTCLTLGRQNPLRPLVTYVSFLVPQNC